MSKCIICNQEQSEVKSCIKHQYQLIDGNIVDPLRVDISEVHNDTLKCIGCEAGIGHFHHIGCAQEKCNLCGDQYISCMCNYSSNIQILKRKKN